MPRPQLERDLRAFIRELTPAERKTTFKPVVSMLKSATQAEVPSRDGSYVVVFDRDPSESEEQAIKKAVGVTKKGNTVYRGVDLEQEGRSVNDVDIWVTLDRLESNRITKLLYEDARKGIEVEEGK